MSDLATQGSDDLRATLESAFSADQSTPQTTAPATAPAVDASAQPAAGTETAEQKAARQRDEAGRFVKTPAEAAKDAKPEAAPTPDAKPQRKLPNSWKRELAAVWTKADAGEALTADEADMLRDEAIRREGDFHTGIQQYKSAAESASKFEQAYKPYEATIRQLGVTPDVAAAHLFGIDHKLRYSSPQDKAVAVAQIIQGYGVDPAHVFQMFQPQQAVDPNLKPIHDEIAQLRQENAELHRQWKTQTQSSQDRELASLNSEISKFAQGKEHFQAVSTDMAAILPLIRAERPDASPQEALQDAYDRAIWARPDLRAVLLKQQNDAAEAKARAALQDQRAKTAAVSLRGSSPASGGAAAPNNSVREALEAALQGHNL